MPKPKTDGQLHDELSAELDRLRAKRAGRVEYADALTRFGFDPTKHPRLTPMKQLRNAVETYRVFAGRKPPTRPENQSC